MYHSPTLKRNLFIYRDALLSASETFILAQGESLSQFKAIYLGLRRTPGLDLPADRCTVLAAGHQRLKTARMRLWGATTSELAHLRTMRPALVHAHFGADASTAISVARALKIPLVVTFHGWDATVRDSVVRRQSIALNLYLKRRSELARFASRVLCVSEFIRRLVLKKGFHPDKTIVHYTGVDVREFIPGGESHTREPIVLFVGRLVEKKGCEIVIGDGALRKDLEAQAQSTLRSFSFLGARSPDVVREWMRKASVFCTPSVVAKSGDAEGFGMVFAEAQAMGLPVASFATGGIPEAVEHGITGLLAPERDTNVLAENIVTLLTDAALWSRFSAAGQERVRQRFDLQQQTAKLEQIYEQVLDEHGGSRAMVS
jgi:glycosyltransferase involved in cell wall biosynthesis